MRDFYHQGLRLGDGSSEPFQPLWSMAGVVSEARAGWWGRLKKNRGRTCVVLISGGVIYSS